MAAAGVNWVFDQTFDEGQPALLEAVKLCLELGMRRERRQLDGADGAARARPIVAPTTSSASSWRRARSST